MHGFVKPPCLDTISFLQHKFAGEGCRVCLGFCNTDLQDGFHVLCALSAMFMYFVVHTFAASLETASFIGL